MESDRSCEVPSSSSQSSWCSAEEEPADPFEIEAAETLADLAQFAAKEKGSESPDEMKDEGKLVRKRVKSESPPTRPELTPFDSVASRAQHVIVKEEKDTLTQQHEKTCESVGLKVVKPDKNAGSYNLNRIYPLRYSSFGGSSRRQILAEAEKEEKRLRRVLANRESARRTIRRRQALCEELTRKAAELAQENEELKKGREAALSEYRLLETTNKQLKKMIAKAMEPQITAPAQLQAVHPEFSAPLTNCPMVLYNGSFRPVFWPTMLQSPIPSHTQQGSAIPPIPSNIVMPALFKPDPFQEKDPLINAPLPRAPVYLIPYPSLFPIPDQADGNHCQSACHPNNKQGVVPLGNPCDATSSSKTIEPFIEGGALLPSAVKQVSPRVAEIGLAEDLNQMPTENDYGCEQQVYAPSADKVQFQSSEHSAVVKHENGLDIDIGRANREPASSQASHTGFVKREDCLQLGVRCSKKKIDAVAAAEARRKRKELTKLKSFQVRHFQMQC